MNKEPSPREAQLKRRIGSVEFSIEEFATIINDLFPKFIEMQKSLVAMLDLGENLLKIDCPIVPSLMTADDESTEHQKILATARLSFICEHVMPSLLTFPKELGPATNSIIDYLLQGEINNIEQLTIKDVVDSNLSQLILVLNDFILPTHEGSFNEDKGLDKNTVVEMSKMVNVVLSYDDEIARAKLSETELVGYNILLLDHIRAITNTNRVLDINYLNTYLNGFNEFSKAFKSQRQFYTPFKFHNLEAHTAWALESFILLLIVIEQECICVLQAMLNVISAFFQEMGQALLARYPVEINQADLMTKYAQLMEWLVASPYKGLRDALFPGENVGNANNLEVFMVAMKILRAELQVAIEMTSVIMIAHPDGIQEMTPIMQYCDQFLQTCTRLRECASGMAKICAEKNDNKSGLLIAHNMIVDAYKVLITPPQNSPMIKTPRSPRSPRGGDSRPHSNNNSPRSKSGSATASPRPSTGATSAIPSPILSREAIKNPSAGSSSRETTSSLFKHAISKDTQQISPRPDSPEPDRRKAPPKDSLRTSNFKKVVAARKSEGVAKPEDTAAHAAVVQPKKSGDSARKFESGSHSWHTNPDSPKVKGRPSVMSLFTETNEGKLNLTRTSEGSAMNLDLSKLSPLEKQPKSVQPIPAPDPEGAKDHAVDNSTQTSDSASSESSNTI